MTHEEAKERCTRCEYFHRQSDGCWHWPCSECSGSTATLVVPTKDYFSDKPRVRKFKVHFYKTGKNGAIEDPPKTTVIFGRTETEVEHKFKSAYRVYNDLIFGWAEEMDDVKCPE